MYHRITLFFVDCGLSCAFFYFFWTLLSFVADLALDLLTLDSLTLDRLSPWTDARVCGIYTEAYRHKKRGFDGGNLLTHTIFQLLA